MGLDAAGAPLHMRGYRVAQHQASLREHLAAAMILHAGWDPARPLHDPFCGSGTLLIEAAMLATRTAPSHFRPGFACESWTDRDPEALAQVRRAAAEARITVPGLRLSGADRDEAAVDLARRNLAAAGFGDLVTVRTQDVSAMEPVLGGVVVANPPYGERLADPELRDTWRAFREAARRCQGSVVVVLEGHPDFEKTFSLRPFKKNRMNNGAIPCTLFQYRIG